MTDQASLAAHLQRAAHRTPHAVALRYGDRQWRFAELFADDTPDNTPDGIAPAGTPAESPAPAASPCRLAGDSLTLALAAYRCSRENRPFWPVDRNPSPEIPPPPPPLPPPGTALIISTSGSEGEPRAICLGLAQLDTAAAGANARLDLHAGDIWLACLPLYHIGGQSILWRCARAAATVLLHDGFELEAVARDLHAHPVSHISLVPAMLARLLERGITPPPSLRVALIGGAALAQPLYDRARAAGWPLVPSYGLTEAAALIASHTPADGPWQAGQVGRLLPGHEAALDPRGRLRLRGPQLATASLTGALLDAEGWLTTGDLGEIDTGGRITLLGRADDMLISGGRNIHPLTVESCLAALPGVHDLAVTGLPDPVWGDRIVAVIVGPVTPAAVIAHARAHLPGAAVPRSVLIVERLPRNAAGKIDRPALRRLVREAAC